MAHLSGFSWKKINTTFGESMGLFCGSKKIAQVSYNSCCPKNVTDRKYVGRLLLPQPNQPALYAETEVELKIQLESLSKNWLIDAGLLNSNEQTASQI